MNTLAINDPKFSITQTGIEFHQDAPLTVLHDGLSYHFTGKSGTNLKTGLPVREMATEDDARLWITLDGQQVWED